MWALGIKGSSELVNLLGQITSVMAPLLPWSLQFAHLTVILT